MRGANAPASEVSSVVWGPTGVVPTVADATPALDISYGAIQAGPGPYCHGQKEVGRGLKTLGRHILVELYECDREYLNDTRKIRDVMVEAAKVARCHVIKDFFHKFSPHGVSGVVVVSESHLAIHTW